MSSSEQDRSDRPSRGVLAPVSKSYWPTSCTRTPAAQMMSEAGFDVSTMTVDISSRESIQAFGKQAPSLGHITGLIHAASVSPSQQPSDVILKIDLYGTAMLLEEFCNVITSGAPAS